jgi:hypothetical protein
MQTREEGWEESSVEILLHGGFGNQLFQLMYVLGKYPDKKIILDAQVLRPRLNQRGVPELSELKLPLQVEIKFGKRSLFKKIFNLGAIIRKLALTQLNTIESQRKGIEGVAREVALQLLLSLYLWKWVTCDLEGVKVVDSKNVVVVGYFQNNVNYAELGVQKIKAILRGSEIHEKFRDEKSVCQGENVLGVHVRKGDYAGSPNFGILHFEYYKNALKALEDKTKFQKVWIFAEEASYADDIVELFEKNYSVEVLTRNQTGSELTTLLKMSKCNSFIMANSTFSWWGGSLIIDQTNVVAPSPWFYMNAHFEPVLSSTWHKSAAKFRS